VAFVVLAYPTISQIDYAWIQRVRAEHDQLYFKIVEPHFTLVFPIFDLAEATLVAHVVEQARKTDPFRFVLRRAVTVKDSFNEHTHVFLVPDEGSSEITQLHDALYCGPLASHLRIDIPFIPHLAIGNSLDSTNCKLLADQLNDQTFEIDGMIQRLDVVNYENHEITTIKAIELG
jgi:hypothetical protein